MPNGSIRIPGLIIGTPTPPGSFPAKLTVTDSLGLTAQVNLAADRRSEAGDRDEESEGGKRGQAVQRADRDRERRLAEDPQAARQGPEGLKFNTRTGVLSGVHDGEVRSG